MAHKRQSPYSSTGCEQQDYGKLDCACFEGAVSAFLSLMGMSQVKQLQWLSRM